MDNSQNGPFSSVVDELRYIYTTNDKYHMYKGIFNVDIMFVVLLRISILRTWAF